MSYPIDEVKKGVVAVAHVLNVLSKVFHSGGLLALYGILEPVSVLRSLDYAKFKQQVLDLSGDEEKEVEAAFKQELVLENQAVEIKIESAVDIVHDVVGVVEGGISLYNSGKAIFDRVKALFQKAA